MPYLFRYLISGTLFFCTVHAISGQVPCFDSLAFTVDPVQCYSYRNGAIFIDSVYGGNWPFYYSMDKVTFSTRSFFDRLEAGEYTITVRDKDGCDQDWKITVPEPEELKVHLFSSVTSIPNGKPFFLHATYDPPNALIQDISWRPTVYFPLMNTLTQTVQISQTTVFAIEIVSASGCTARDQVLVEAEVPNLYFPNIIRVGSNQDAYFTAFAGDGVQQIALLKIFGRDGSVVFERTNFEANDPLLGWNARSKGRVVQPGVFTWISDIILLDGSKIRKTGTITVIK